MKYEGNKPDINDYVEYIDNKTVCKWKLGEMSMVIGVRVPTITGYNLLDDEILIQLQSCIGNLDIEEPQSLYTTENEALEFIERENQARRTTKEPLERLDKNIKQMNNNMIVFSEKLKQFMKVMKEFSKILTACGYCGDEDIINNNEPLFTSKIDARGRLTIREDVRQRKGIKPGDKVDVFKLEKKDNNNI